MDNISCRVLDVQSVATLPLTLDNSVGLYKDFIIHQISILDVYKTLQDLILCLNIIFGSSHQHCETILPSLRNPTYLGLQCGWTFPSFLCYVTHLFKLTYDLSYTCTCTCICTCIYTCICTYTCTYTRVTSDRRGL